MQRDPEKLYEVSEWRVSRVGDLVQIINGYPFDSAGFSSEGWPLIRIRDLNKEVTETHFNGPAVAAATVTRDDVLVGMDGDFNVGRWKSTEPAMLNQRMLALRGPSDLLTVLEYALERPLREINDTTYATTVKHLSSGQVRAIRVRLPSNPKDISALAVFLDRETGEIDAFIRDQEELIGLLQERRAATISHAVTRGIDENAVLADSGIGWLGEIPLDWTLLSLRRLTSRGLQYGANEAADSADPAGIRYLRITDFRQDGSLRNSTFRSLPREVAAPYMVEPGDVLLARSGATVGKAFLVPHETPPSCFAGYLIRVRLDQALLLPAFFFLYTQSAAFAIWKSLTLTAATIENIGADKYGSLPVPVPPVADQQRLVDALVPVLGSLDDSIRDARLSISLSRERRAALVSAAVTGKIDVYEHAGV